MSLRTRVSRLRTAAVAVDDVAKIKNRTGDLKALSDRLVVPGQTLRTLIPALAELDQIGARLDAESLHKVAETVTSIRDLARRVSDLPADATLDPPKSQVKAVDDLAGKLSLFVEAHWLPFRDQELPAIDEALLKALAAGGVDVEGVHNRLFRAQTTFTGLKYKSVPATGDVARFQDALATLRSCGEEISTLVDPILAEGILRSQIEGIPLTWFTQERLKAVTELGILDRFRVYLK